MIVYMPSLQNQDFFSEAWCFWSRQFHVERFTRTPPDYLETSNNFILLTQDTYLVPFCMWNRSSGVNPYVRQRSLTVLESWVEQSKEQCRDGEPSGHCAGAKWQETAAVWHLNTITHTRMQPTSLKPGCGGSWGVACGKPLPHSQPPVTSQEQFEPPWNTWPTAVETVGHNVFVCVCQCS